MIGFTDIFIVILNVKSNFNGLLLVTMDSGQYFIFIIFFIVYISIIETIR